MSIDAYVLKQKNELVEKIYTPIMSREFFVKCVMPAVETQGLNWLRGLSVGIDVNNENIASVTNELSMLKRWGRDNLNKEDYTYLDERIARLESMLAKVFQLEEVTVFIG